MRFLGMSCLAISDALNIGYEAVRRAVNPKSIEKKRLAAVEWRRTHKKEIQRYAKRYERRKRHKPRYARIQKMAAGDPKEIKEIYRKAKEDPKVRCYLCGKLIPIGHRHVDHIVPLSKGGVHRPSNLAVACDNCNREKHTKMPEEVGILV